MPLPKGVSGNPSGGTREQARLRNIAARAAAQYIEEAVNVYVRIMRDPEALAAAQVSAATAILDRAVGKAIAPIEHSGEVTHSYVIETPTQIIDATSWQIQNDPTKRLLSQ